METHFEPRISRVLKSCENVGINFVFTELTVGLLFGFIARLFFLALQFITAMMTQAIGLSAT